MSQIMSQTISKSMLVVELLAFWQKRDARERQWLRLSGIFIACVLIYLMGVNPALSNSKRLKKYIPELNQQVAAISQMSNQYTEIAKSLGENVIPMTREFIDSTLSRRSIKAQSLSVSNDIVRVQINAVAYNTLMEWIFEMQKAARITVDEAKVTALTEPGQVGAVLTLRQQKGSR
jgi:general secretion pathway protein M